MLIEISQYTKSKYDFSDEATRFFYDLAEILYHKRTQTFNKTTVSTFVAEDNERLSLYKKYGGWTTIENWMKLAIVDDFKNYFQLLKKYSLLREYQRGGFNVEKILSHKKFETFTALDIYKMVRSKVDRIHTVILTNQESEILNSKISNTLNQCLEKPDMGLKIPYPLCNELFRGFKLGNMMAYGALSNAGKSRFAFKIIAYISLVLKEKICVLLNEMSIESMRMCLITTCINNPEFQELHGIKINKNERELSLGLYKDNKGDFVYRKTDSDGNYTETMEEYRERLINISDEYNKIMRIAEWIEGETEGLIFAKDVSSAYDDKSLSFEIRKAHLTNGINYFVYDTLKNEKSSIGEWSMLQATATGLSELAKEMNVFVYCSLQLTDDTNHIRPEDLSSSNIASAKHIKHILDMLILTKEISKTDYGKYQFLSNYDDWGEPILHNLNDNKRYMMAVVDKNRLGEKKKILFSFDLNKNTWFEEGEIFRK